jgi:hypothetical protein
MPDRISTSAETYEHLGDVLRLQSEVAGHCPAVRQLTPQQQARPLVCGRESGVRAYLEAPGINGQAGFE